VGTPPSPDGSYSERTTQRYLSKSRRKYEKNKHFPGRRGRSVEELTRIILEFEGNEHNIEDLLLAETGDRNKNNEEGSGSTTRWKLRDIVDTSRLVGVMDYWAKQRSSEGAEMCEKILYKVAQHDNMVDDTNDRLLDTRLHTICMDALSKLQSRTGKSNNASVKAERILQLMKDAVIHGNKAVAPNTYTYTVCMDCWAKSGSRNAGERAETLLMEMEKLHEKEGWSCVAKPNSYSYATAINAWSKSPSKDAPDRAFEILKRFDTIITSSGPASAKSLGAVPGIHSYSSCLNAFAQAGNVEGAEWVYQMLESRFAEGYEELRPNQVCFTTLIKAHATRGRLDSGAKARKIFDRVKELYEQGYRDMKPNTFVYNILFHAVGQQDPEESDRMLDDLIQAYLDTRDEDICPSPVTFITVCNNYAKNKTLPDGALKAEAILNKMQKLNEQKRSFGMTVEPDIHAYNIVSLHQNVHNQQDLYDSSSSRGPPIFRCLFVIFVGAGRLAMERVGRGG
jgi:hypothetical protein